MYEGICHMYVCTSMFVGLMFVACAGLAAFHECVSAKLWALKQ